MKTYSIWTDASYVTITTSVVYVHIYICARIDMLSKSKCRHCALKHCFADLNLSYQGIYRHGCSMYTYILTYL